MSSEDVKDFADRVKKFYYSRALLSQELYTSTTYRGKLPITMSPDSYDPLSKLYEDAFILACSAIDGLSSMWRTLEMPQSKWGNQKLFTEFLEKEEFDSRMALVSTPFLYYRLVEQNIEQAFREAIYEEWVKEEEEDENRQHLVENDPPVEKLVELYTSVGQNQIKNINQTLSDFKYSTLIYKYYRCSFVHKFRPSRFISGFSREEELSIRQRSDVPHPQLDIGLGVLTNIIIAGADYIHSRIIKRKIIRIPYSSDDVIIIETNSP